MLVAALYSALSPRHAVVHAKELSVPGSAQHSRAFSRPVHMQVCSTNAGAESVANLILAATRQCQPQLTFKVVPTQSGVLQTKTTHLLVYLNGKTFSDDGSTAALVCQALDGRSGGKSGGRSLRLGGGPALLRLMSTDRISRGRGRSETHDGRERSETGGTESGRSLRGTERRSGGRRGRSALRSAAVVVLVHERDAARDAVRLQREPSRPAATLTPVACLPSGPLLAHHRDHASRAERAPALPETRGTPRPGTQPPRLVCWSTRAVSTQVPWTQASPELMAVSILQVQRQMGAAESSTLPAFDLSQPAVPPAHEPALL